MSDIVIHGESLSKRYAIGERERYLALRDVLSRAITAPARIFRPRRGTGVSPVNGNGNGSGTGVLPVNSNGNGSGTGILPVNGNGNGSGTGVSPVNGNGNGSGTGILPVNSNGQRTTDNGRAPTEPRTPNPEPRTGHIWALKDVSFDVRQGEVVGIIGRNGAGKTTLLKILARVTKPTSGYADVRGRMGSLLEVGTGFHPELTGRENVYLSGAILGMSKAEIQRKFDEIVAFAEVAKFIDTPVKHYSVGMRMRLAFAVAAHLEPEILLVDEVLSVGDLEFQKKCLGKMGKVAEGGRTILFVSHQMNQIRRLCQRAIWVDAGQIRQDGPVGSVLGAYEAASAGQQGTVRSGGSRQDASFRRWRIVESSTDSPNLLTTLGPLGVEFEVEINKPLRRAHHGVALFDANRQLMWAWAANSLNVEPGVHQFHYDFPVLPLRPGPYYWQVTLWDGDDGLLDMWDCTPEMIIATEVHQHFSDEWNGVLNVPCQFAVKGREEYAPACI